MSQLLQLSQRIKTVETIKKTTNAMRLVAMSTHTRLRQSKAHIDMYRQEVNRVLQSVAVEQTTPVEPVIQEKLIASQQPKTLFVVVGSQKGLCGVFNTSMAHFFKEGLAHFSDRYDVLVVGKQMREILLYQEVEPVISYDEFTGRTVSSIAREIVPLVLSSTYHQVTFYFTFPKGFFVHSHKTMTLSRDEFRSSPTSRTPSQQVAAEGEEQSYEAMFNALGLLVLKGRIEGVLCDSLMAEAAARFLSMDGATRNADELIDAMRLDYNKLRQASITRELTDLAGSFMGPNQRS